MQVGNRKEAKALLNNYQFHLRYQQQQQQHYPPPLPSAPPPSAPPTPEHELDSLLAMTLHWMGTHSYRPSIVLEILQDFLLEISHPSNNTDKFVYRQFPNPSN